MIRDMINVLDDARAVGGIPALIEKLKAKVPGETLEPNTVYAWNSRRIGRAWELPYVEVMAEHGISRTLADIRGQAVEAAE